MPKATIEEIAAIMIKALSASDELWNALPEDMTEGDDMIRAALVILQRRASEICA